MTLFGLSACSQVPPIKDSVTKSKIHVTYVEPELRPIVEEYLKEMLKNNISIAKMDFIDSIILVDNKTIICGSETAIGCSYNGMVRIKKNIQYSFFGKDYLKVMVYHELGHALLSLPHSNFFNHVMFPVIHENIDYYIFNWDKFFKSYVTYFKFCEANEFFIK